MCEWLLVLVAQVHAVQCELAAMGTSLVQDQQLMGSCKGVQAMAIMFRIEKKKLLSHVLQQLVGDKAGRTQAALTT